MEDDDIRNPRHQAFIRYRRRVFDGARHPDRVINEAFDAGWDARVWPEKIPQIPCTSCDHLLELDGSGIESKCVGMLSNDPRADTNTKTAALACSRSTCGLKFRATWNWAQCSLNLVVL